MRLRVGQTLTSTADTTTVIVIKAGTGYEFVTCGGVAMVSEPTTAAGPTAEDRAAIMNGDRLPAGIGSVFPTAYRDTGIFAVERKAQRIKNGGLASARLAGNDVQAGVPVDLQQIDDGEITNGQLRDHPALIIAASLSAC